MALGKPKQPQSRLFVSMDVIPRSGGHVFYDQLQRVLRKGGFDSFIESLCAPYYAARQGRPSIPPGRYFRIHLVGYFEGIDSERSFQHVLDRGGQRRTPVRGLENVQNNYLLAVAGFNSVMQNTLSAPGRRARSAERLEIA